MLFHFAQWSNILNMMNLHELQMKKNQPLHFSMYQSETLLMMN